VAVELNEDIVQQQRK